MMWDEILTALLVGRNQAWDGLVGLFPHNFSYLGVYTVCPDNQVPHMLSSIREYYSDH